MLPFRNLEPVGPFVVNSDCSQVLRFRALAAAVGVFGWAFWLGFEFGPGGQFGTANRSTTGLEQSSGEMGYASRLPSPVKARGGRRRFAVHKHV
jgi:hypothetical protein